ncbi:MAG: hypothetical protein AB1589_41625 [Cyanobacteriota bacterium]
MNQRPDALLEELCEGWAQQSGTQVSVPTRHRALQRLGSRRKKNAITPNWQQGLEESEPHKNRGNFIALPYLFGNQLEHGDAVTH